MLFYGVGFVNLSFGRVVAMPRKQGRPRKGRELLTRERILRTALELVDAHGIEALSMRRLAAELGVDPMAIYHHLPGKEAILEGITELAFAELRVEPSGDDDWREQVRAFARAYRDLVRTHPHLTLLLIANVEAGGASVLKASERLYEALERSGLPHELIVPAAGVIVDYVHGFALSEGLALRASDPGEGGLVALLERYPSMKLPAMRRAMRASVGASAHFDLEEGINLILSGIAAMIPPADRRFPGRP